jgi:hypothetical protein
VTVAGGLRVEYVAPGEAEPVYLTRRRTVYDAVFVNGEPYVIHLNRSRKTGRLFLRATPLFAYSEDVVRYVREKIKECPWLHASGEEYRRILREYGIPPQALCIKMIMEGRRFPKRERKKVTKTDLIIAQLIAAAAEKQERKVTPPPAVSPPLASPAASTTEGILRLWRGGGHPAAPAIEEILRLWGGTARK